MTRFLVKANPHRSRGRNSVQIADALGVVFTMRLKRVGKVGPFNEVAANGHYSDRVNLAISEGIDGFGADASKRRYSIHGLDLKATAVRSVIRELRDQEAEKIDQLREKQTELTRQMDTVEEELDQAMRAAFSKGRVVTIGELKSMAEEGS